MKHLRLFLFLSLIFFSITVIANDCPYMRQEKAYECTYLVLENTKVPFNGALTMSMINGSQTILIKGNVDDEDIVFVIIIDGNLTKSNSENGISYIGVDEKGKGVLIGNWTNGDRIVMFSFEDESVGVVYDAVPFADLND